LKKTINVGAWVGERLVGTVRVLSDGYFFNTIPELMVDPEFQRRGIGRELMYRAVDLTPGGHFFSVPRPAMRNFSSDWDFNAVRLVSLGVGRQF
jgi:GNAT superfamily N-acetyltransferase